MSQRNKSRLLPLAAHVLKEYRAKHNITQEVLANELFVDVRTVRRWENGDTPLTDVRELKRLAILLGIEPERLGLLPDLTTPEEIDEVINRVWQLIKLARYHDANILVERLVPAVTNLLHTEDEQLLRRLAATYHVTGYVKSQVTRANETLIPFSHYQEMERIARILDDQTLLNVALTYEGDMLQRGGDVAKGIEYLEAARDTTPLADISARGNGIQLLGRAYFKAERLGDFERIMGEAEDIGALLDATDVTSGAKGQYSLGTVYEEYGRSYGLLGQTQKAMGYLEKAHTVFTIAGSQNRDVLIQTAKAMALVHGGEIKEGIEVAVDAVRLCRMQGNTRLMDRIYGVQQYLDKIVREIGQAGGVLREVLYGPVEY